MTRALPFPLAAVLGWLLLFAPRAAAQAEPPGVQVLVTRITGAIDFTTVALVRRTLREASASGASRVVLEIDTPGGELAATQELETLIAGVRGDGIHTVAWVRNQAYSAGAYVAMACNQLFMAPGGKIGAITPVVLGPEGVQQIPDDDVRNKQISALRSAVRSLVQQRGTVRPGLEVAAEAMVDPRLTIYEITYVDKAGIEESVIRDEAGLREMREAGVRVVRAEQFSTRPLTLTAGEALRIGLSSGTLGSLEELVRDQFGLTLAQVGRVDSTWSEDAAAWLNAMKPFLFVFGFLLLLIEMKTPGFAVPGVLGLLLLGLAMFGSYLVGLAEWTEILMFFLGLGLIAVEVFVLPGFVVFGLVGFLCVVFALVLSQQTFVLPATEAEHDLLVGNLLAMLWLILLVVACSVAFWRLLPRIPVLNRVVLQPPTGLTGTIHAPEIVRAGGPLVGRVGVALTDLRPAGIVELEDERLDVVTEGAFLPRGTAVRILAVHGNRIVVERAPDPSQSGEVSIGLLVLLVVIGLALVIAEVFLVSFGLIAVMAAVSLVSAVFLAFTHHGQGVGFLFLSIAAIGAPTCVYFALRFLPHTGIGRALILGGPTREQVQNAASEPGLERLLHRTGETVSDLRPAGFARIDGARIDVVTRGEMIERGVPVRVIEVEGNRVVVARHREEPQNPPLRPPAEPSSSQA